MQLIKGEQERLSIFFFLHWRQFHRVIGGLRCLQKFIYNVQLNRVCCTIQLGEQLIVNVGGHHVQPRTWDFQSFAGQRSLLRQSLM